MPIHLQNHRTSNAKLFSATGQKQKLHTAASFQKARGGGVTVVRNPSGHGSGAGGFMGRTKRRHSLSGNIQDDAEALSQDPMSGMTVQLESTSTSAGGAGSTSPKRSSKIKSVKKSASLDSANPTTSVDQRKANRRKIKQLQNPVRRAASFGVESVRASLFGTSKSTTTTTESSSSSSPRSPKSTKNSKTKTKTKMPPTSTSRAKPTRRNSGTNIPTSSRDLSSLVRNDSDMDLSASSSFDFNPCGSSSSSSNEEEQR